MDKKDSEQEEAVVKSFETPSARVVFKPKILAVFLVIILLGVGSGFLAAKVKPNVGSANVATSENTKPTSITKGTIVGSNDLKTFKDSTEGTLKNGGIDGEGQYHLVRPGGDSQNVYLTSSSVDLSLFIDRKIKVWGQTQAAQYAGWLMDVGRVEVE